jgi:uncharacterized protein
MYGAISRRDFPALRGILADDVVWKVPGTNRIAGEHEGFAAVLSLLERSFEVTEGTLRIELHDVLANDVHCVALVHLAGTRGGKTINVAQKHIGHLRDGKLTDLSLRANEQEKVDELFR